MIDHLWPALFASNTMFQQLENRVSRIKNHKLLLGFDLIVDHPIAVANHSPKNHLPQAGNKRIMKVDIALE